MHIHSNPSSPDSRISTGGGKVTLEELRAQALGLDIDSRAALAQALLESLDQPSEQEVLRLALDEAEQRQADVRSGKVQMLPGEEVMDRLSKAFG
jgi:hypothetical protein